MLRRASAAVHGRSAGSSGGQRSAPSRGRGGRGGGGRHHDGGDSWGADEDGRRRRRSSCPPHQNVLDCFRDQWTAAGLADLGGALFFWATVLGEYPYADGSGGYARPLRDEEGVAREWRTAFRVEAEAGYVLAGAGRISGGARMQLPFYVDLATRYTVFVEPDVVGIASFLLGRVDLEVRVIDANGAQLRIGAGLRHAHDAIGSVLGGGFGIAMDLFPVQPLVLSASADIGFVGRAAVAALRATLGVMIDRTELFVGYHYDGLLGDSPVDLGGVILGSRVWL